VLPPAVLKELSKLQDNIAPFPTADARALIEAELGQPISVLFSEFSEEPIAAASLAQVGCLALLLSVPHLSNTMLIATVGMSLMLSLL